MMAVAMNTVLVFIGQPRMIVGGTESKFDSRSNQFRSRCIGFDREREFFATTDSGVSHGSTDKHDDRQQNLRGLRHSLQH